MLYVDYIHILRDIIINFASLYLYAYLILYRKYNNKELFISCCLFNIFVLFVVMAVVRTDFNLAIGFGLFALMGLVQVRSRPFSKTEMAYFFGTVSLALINGCGIDDYVFVILANVVIVLCVWFISLWAIEHTADVFEASNAGNITVTLDGIDEDAINNPSVMIGKLSERFRLPVISFNLRRVDYVRDTMNLRLIYDLTRDYVPQTSPAADEEKVSYEPQV